MSFPCVVGIIVGDSLVYQPILHARLYPPFLAFHVVYQCLSTLSSLPTTAMNNDEDGLSHWKRSLTINEATALAKFGIHVLPGTKMSKNW
jgi:hypothetical protein